MLKQIACGLVLAVSISTAYAANEVDLLLDPVSLASDAREVRGVLRARAQAILASELPGRVIAMPFAEGQSFNKNDVLVRFDCSAYQAQANASQAAVKMSKEELAHNQQLASLNSVGRFDVAMAQARLVHAQAEAQVYQVQVNRCQIKAPFDGQVVSRRVQPHESVASGVQLLEIVDNRSLEIHVLVPSRWLGQLKPGERFTFTPDETGQALEATVQRLGARIDEGSQTLLLIATVANEAQGLLSGMSGTAVFAEQP